MSLRVTVTMRSELFEPRFRTLKPVTVLLRILDFTSDFTS